MDSLLLVSTFQHPLTFFRPPILCFARTSFGDPVRGIEFLISINYHEKREGERKRQDFEEGGGGGCVGKAISISFPFFFPLPFAYLGIYTFTVSRVCLFHGSNISYLMKNWFYLPDSVSFKLASGAH